MRHKQSLPSIKSKKKEGNHDNDDGVQPNPDETVSGDTTAASTVDAETSMQIQYDYKLIRHDPFGETRFFFSNLTF